MRDETIRIVRGRGGEVEVDGPIDAFAADILARAGFATYPQLSGVWIRLPFDLGRERENTRATWAAEMLTAARYPVDIDPDLRITTVATAGGTAGRRTPAAQVPPSASATHEPRRRR